MIVVSYRYDYFMLSSKLFINSILLSDKNASEVGFLANEVTADPLKEEVIDPFYYDSIPPLSAAPPKAIVPSSYNGKFESLSNLLVTKSPLIAGLVFALCTKTSEGGTTAPI